MLGPRNQRIENKMDVHRVTVVDKHGTICSVLTLPKGVGVAFLKATIIEAVETLTGRFRCDGCHRWTDPEDMCDTPTESLCPKCIVERKE